MLHGSTSTRFVHVIALAVVLGALGAAQSGPKFHHLHGGEIGGVYFVNSSQGATAEDGARVRYTQDGGVSWLYGFVPHQPEEIRVRLRGVFFLPFPDENLGWCVGDNGVVLSSTDFGANWTDANPNSRVKDSLVVPGLACDEHKATLFDIFMTDSLNGFCVGNDGCLRTTANGGVNWTKPSGLPGEFNCSSDPDLVNDIYDIHFFADSSPGLPYSRGIIATDGGYVFTTTDAGVSWSKVNVVVESSPPPLNNLCPALLIGPGGQILENVENWSISFENPLVAGSPGLLVGGAGTNKGFIFRTTNGGLVNSWSQSRCYDALNPNDPENMLEVCGLSTPYGVAVLGSGMALTAGYDSQLMQLGSGTADFDPCLCIPGTSTCTELWIETENHPTPTDVCNASPPLKAVAKVSATQAVLVGTFGRLSRFDASATPKLQEKGTRYQSRLGDGVFTSSTTGFVIGQGYVIKGTVDSGQTWNDKAMSWSCNTDLQGNAIAFSTSGQFGVAVGTAGFIARSSDYGSTWTQVTVTPAHPDLNAVAFVPNDAYPPFAAETIYVVGSGGVVLRSDNDGFNWTPVPIPVSETLYGVAFATQSVGYVVGANKTVYQTRTKGVSWDPVTVSGGPQNVTFLDVETWDNGTPAIAVASGGNFYEKTATTLTWQAITGVSATTENLNDVEVLNAGVNVRVGGDNGLVLFRDSGTWTKPKSQTNEPLFRLSFQDTGHGYAIGKQFVILRYE